MTGEDATTTRGADLPQHTGQSVRTQVEWEDRRTHYFDLYERAPAGYVTLSEAGLIQEANLTFATLLGRERGTLLREPISGIIFPGDRSIYSRLCRQLTETLAPQTCELRLLKRDGTPLWMHLAATAAREANRTPVLRLILSDITAHKLQDSAHEFTAHLIVLVNMPGDFRKRMTDLTASLQAWSGCEAVGIRLRDGDDYPYYETRGFPSLFVQAERSLCAYGPGGKILQDGAGHPVLECMCGNILSGRFDPGLPFFTSRGSFWTNSTTDLLAGIPANERQARNRCNSEGYESVALIPLRQGNQVFGLLQFNDRRPDRFTPDLIVCFERMADSLAVALSRRQIKTTLQESERKYRALASTVDSLVVVDRHCRHLFANDAYLQQLGMEENRVIGREYGEFHNEEASTLFAKAIKSVFATGSPCQDERLGQRSGKWWFRTFSPVTNDEGTITAVIVAYKDITDRKLTEEALRASEEKFRSIYEESPMGIELFDRHGMLLDANKACLEIFGISDASAIKGFQLFEDPNLSAELRAQLRSGENVRYEISFDFEKVKTLGLYETTRSGTICLDLLITTFGGDKKGSAIGYLVHVRDITRRKEGEAERTRLDAMNRQLQKAESLGRMAGAIAHTFNNQLGAVIGNLELAMLRLPEGSSLHKNMVVAMGASQRAAAVSGQMLTYLGQSFDKQEPLDLAEACRQGLSLLRAAMPNTVTLETELSAPGPIIMANQHNIDQILNNLLTNAWEALGTGGGVIRLCTGTVSGADITAVNRFPLNWQPQSAAYACLEVTDRGCGIADQDIEKLFDPFFTSKFTGRGLGLPILLGILKAHGGAVTVASKPEEGSVFRVFLPLSVPEVPASTDQPNTAGTGTILLAEDEEMVRSMAAAMLRQLGFTVLEAKDGSEAVDVFYRHRDKIRAVLCDLTMPRLNGWETLTALRRLAPGVPVILASGYDKAQVMAGDHPELPQAFLAKPYNLKKLSETIGLVMAGISPSGKPAASSDSFVK